MTVITVPHHLEYCMQFASLALIYYDYFLTLHKEIKYIWKRRFHAMSIAFLLCRYSLVANVTFLVGLFNKDHHTSCDDLYIFSAVLSVAGRIGIMAILGGRAIAVWRHNRYVTAMFCVMGCLVTCLAMLHIPRVSCNGAKVKESRTVVDLLGIFTVVYEVLSTSFLVIGCSRDFDSFKQVEPLTMLLIREGLLYSGLVTGLTGTGIWLNWVAPVGSFWQRFLNSLMIPVSGIMSARFLLHVREWQEWDQNMRILEALPLALGSPLTSIAPAWPKDTPGSVKDDESLRHGNHSGDSLGHSQVQTSSQDSSSFGIREMRRAAVSIV